MFPLIDTSLEDFPATSWLEPVGHHLWAHVNMLLKIFVDRTAEPMDTESLVVNR